MKDTDPTSQLMTRNLNGVTFVRRSNLGPTTVHATGPSEDTKPFDSRIPQEEAQEIIDRYVASLKAGIPRAVDAQTTPAKPSANAAYVKERLETMGAQDKALMESCLKDHPGLTPEEFVEMAMMHGF
jgi:hypothetical protein